MPIDTSVYGNIKQPDPFGTLGSMVGIQQGVAQNKLLQLQLLGKTAGAQALKDSIGPDGQLDPVKLGTNLKNAPGVATTEALPTATTVVGGQIANKQGSQNLAQTGFANVGSAFGSLLARTTGPITHDMLVEEVMNLTSQGRISDPKVAAAIIKGIPSDEKALRSWAAGGWVQSLPPALQVGAAPAPPAVGGQPRQQTGAQFATQSVDGEAPPAGTAPPGGPAVAPGAPTPAPRPSPAPAPGVVTGQSPADIAAAGPVGTQSGTNFANLATIADQYPNRIAALGNMEVDLEKSFSGPLTPEIQRMVAGLNQVLGTNIGIDNVAATERINKLVSTIVAQQATALSLTDQNTMIAMGANPSSNLSKLGNKYIIAMLKGNEDAIKLKNAEAQKWLDANGMSTYGKWSSEFNKNFDPRVFQSTYMSASDKQAMIDQMSDAEYNTFRQRYNDAVAKGWIAGPKGATNGK